MISSGETTVTVTGSGTGGRNQEFALARRGARTGFDTYALASLGTDGIDGPTDAAGAIVDSTTLAARRAAEFDPDRSSRTTTIPMRFSPHSAISSTPVRPARTSATSK